MSLMVVNRSGKVQKRRGQKKSIPLWTRGHQEGKLYWLRQRNSKKKKTVEQKEIVAWQPVTLCDDTLLTVLGTVNKCVREMLWRVFRIKKQNANVWSNGSKPSLPNDVTRLLQTKHHNVLEVYSTYLLHSMLAVSLICSSPIFCRHLH